MLLNYTRVYISIIRTIYTYFRPIAKSMNWPGDNSTETAVAITDIKGEKTEDKPGCKNTLNFQWFQFQLSQYTTLCRSTYPAKCFYEFAIYSTTNQILLIMFCNTALYTWSYNTLTTKIFNCIISTMTCSPTAMFNVKMSSILLKT